MSCDRSRRWLKLAEVVRDELAWHEAPVNEIEAKWWFLERLGQRDLRLASRVSPIDYQWKLGRQLPLPAPAPEQFSERHRRFQR